MFSLSQQVSGDEIRFSVPVSYDEYFARACDVVDSGKPQRVDLTFCFSNIDVAGTEYFVSFFD